MLKRGEYLGLTSGPTGQWEASAAYLKRNDGEISKCQD